MKRHSRFVLFCLATFVCAGSSFLAQQIYVASRHGFGAGDVWAFLLWLMPLSVITGGVAVALGGSTLRPVLRHTLSVIFSLVGGFLFTWGVAMFLGPWFQAFSFPVLYFWMLGPLLGLLLGNLYVSYRSD